MFVCLFVYLFVVFVHVAAVDVVRWLQSGVMQAEAFRVGCAEVFPVSQILSHFGVTTQGPTVYTKTYICTYFY